jgi:hypothetical protein
VVHNVESLMWLGAAADDTPVTDKWLTVTGAVKSAQTFVCPLGTSFGDLGRRTGDVTCLRECKYRVASPVVASRVVKNTVSDPPGHVTQQLVLRS